MLAQALTPTSTPVTRQCPRDHDHQPLPVHSKGQSQIAEIHLFGGVRRILGPEVMVAMAAVSRVGVYPTSNSPSSA